MNIKNNKHWNHMGHTPGFGEIYHHKIRRTVMVIYNKIIVLYHIGATGSMYPCNSILTLKRHIQ